MLGPPRIEIEQECPLFFPEAQLKWGALFEQVANNEVYNTGPKILKSGQTIWDVVVYKAEVAGYYIWVEVNVNNGLIINAGGDAIVKQ